MICLTRASYFYPKSSPLDVQANLYPTEVLPTLFMAFESFFAFWPRENASNVRKNFRKRLLRRLTPPWYKGRNETWRSFGESKGIFFIFIGYLSCNGPSHKATADICGKGLEILASYRIHGGRKNWAS